MTEVLNHRLATGSEAYSDKEDQLFDMSAFEADVEESSQEISPAAARVREAAERAATFLEDRAINKAHGDAIKEDTERTRTAQSEAYDSYSDNISATRNRIREERIDAIEAKIDSAKKRVGGFGRAALNRLKNGGMITLGLGLMAGESAGRGVKRGAEATRNGAQFAAETVKTNAEVAAGIGSHYASQGLEATKDGIKNAADSAEAFAGRMGQKMENGIQSGIDKAGEMRQKFLDKMEAAKARKQARRDRWSARFNTAKDMATDKVERSKASVHTTRAAGSAALAAFRNTRRIHTEQNKLY